MVVDYDLRFTIYGLRCPWDVPGKQWISMKIGGQAWISVSMDIYVSSGTMVAPPYGTLVRRSYDVCSNFAWWSRRIVGRPVSRLVAEGDASCPLESFESAC